MSWRTKLDALRERNTRLWMGASFGAWCGFLRRHGLRFAASRLHLAVACSILSPANSLLGRLGDRLFARADSTPLPTPIFVLGHWRSGTTLLHQLLSLDPRAMYPTTWECCAPHASLWLSERAAQHLPLRVPASRPMDGVEISWASPQEDEFALASMGVPSPYEWFAFPRSCLDAAGRARFLELARHTPVAPTLRRLMRRMVSRRRRGLATGRTTGAAGSHRFVVLKSPTHSFRLDHLRREFPTARFLCIHRDPEPVYSSTKRLWRSLSEHQGLQRSPFAGPDGEAALEAHVMGAMESMRASLEQDLERWAEDPADRARRFCELDYADIDPTDPRNSSAAIAARIGALYAQLGLAGPAGSLSEDFERPLISFLERQRGYTKNEFQALDPARRRRLGQVWGGGLLSPGA